MRGVAEDAPLATKDAGIVVDAAELAGLAKKVARRQGDLHFIRVGSERYEFPEGVVLGG